MDVQGSLPARFVDDLPMYGDVVSMDGVDRGDMRSLLRMV